MRLSFESLEQRRLLSGTTTAAPNPAVFIDDRVLHVVSTGDVMDVISVEIEPTTVDVRMTAVQRFERSRFDSIVIDGGPANDTLYLQPSTSIIPVTVRGGDGNDHVDIGRPYDFTVSGTDIAIFGDSGNDGFKLYGTLIPDLLDGGNGVDGVEGDWHERLDLRDFVSVENGFLWAGTLIGTDGPNILAQSWVPSARYDTSAGGFVYPRQDVAAYGNGGDDQISMSVGGNCTLDGGAGNDRMFQMGGNTRMYGGPGDDHLRGDTGNDYIDGGDGNDTLIGNEGADTLNGRAGRDRLYGGDGRDRLAGNGGHDRLFGQSDGDRLYGGAGNDVLDGGGSIDRLQGDSGSDVMYGQGGDDRFFAVDGEVDQLFGGRGRDSVALDRIDIFDEIGALP